MVASTESSSHAILLFPQQGLQFLSTTVGGRSTVLQTGFNEGLVENWFWTSQGTYFRCSTEDEASVRNLPRYALMMSSTAKGRSLSPLTLHVTCSQEAAVDRGSAHISVATRLTQSVCGGLLQPLPRRPLHPRRWRWRCMVESESNCPVFVSPPAKPRRARKEFGFTRSAPPPPSASHPERPLTFRRKRRSLNLQRA